MLVTGSEHKSVQSFDDIFEALMFGQRSRAVASTNQNDRSSRSHTIFVISYKQINPDGAQKQGRLNLVDLAGSERIAKTGATGKTLQEATKINSSLTALGLVIKALTDNKGHIPFRDSKLTLLLKDALGGNSKTTLICTASKQLKHLEESIQTLQFAERAKRIKNKAAANVLRSPEEMAKMIEKLKVEVASLKAQLINNGLTPATGIVKAIEEPAEEIKVKNVDTPIPDKKVEAAVETAEEKKVEVLAAPKEEKKAEESQSESEFSAAATKAMSKELSLTSVSKDEEAKKDVSFNTLLDDSTISFNPDNEPKVSAGISNETQVSLPLVKTASQVGSRQEDLAQISSLTAQIDEQAMKITELENEYEHYRTKTQTEIMQLKDQNETLQGTINSIPNADGVLNKFKDHQYQMAQKDAEIERLKDDFKLQL